VRVRGHVSLTRLKLRNNAVGLIVEHGRASAGRQARAATRRPGGGARRCAGAPRRSRGGATRTGGPTASSAACEHNRDEERPPNGRTLRTLRLRWHVPASLYALTMPGPRVHVPQGQQ
jgi:hypothetical protein